MISLAFIVRQDVPGIIRCRRVEEWVMLSFEWNVWGWKFCDKDPTLILQVSLELTAVVLSRHMDNCCYAQPVVQRHNTGAGCVLGF